VPQILKKDSNFFLILWEILTLLFICEYNGITYKIGGIKMATRNDRLNVRVTDAQKRLISRAAKSTHSSVSDFVLRSVCRASEQVLMEQTTFFLNEEDYVAFQEALERPAQYNPKLNKILKEKAPWEE